MKKSIVCSWIYSKEGKRELDCYLEIESLFDAQYVRAIDIRTRFQGGHSGLGLFLIPEAWDRSILAQIIPTLTEDQVSKAHKELKGSIYTLSVNDPDDKWRDHIEELPLMMGISGAIDRKIKKVFNG